MDGIDLGDVRSAGDVLAWASDHLGALVNALVLLVIVGVGAVLVVALVRAWTRSAPSPAAHARHRVEAERARHAARAGRAATRARADVPPDLARKLAAVDAVLRASQFPGERAAARTARARLLAEAARRRAAGSADAAAENMPEGL